MFGLIARQKLVSLSIYIVFVRELHILIF